MASQTSTDHPLEQLRSLINKSIDIVQDDLAKNNDPPLNLSAKSRHPLRDRYDPNVARALRCISSSGLMLKALCDPDAALHDIMFGFHDHTALFVACQADVASFIADRDCNAYEIAENTGISADKMSRYLRALCNVHIFCEVEPEVFANNELSLLLRSEGKRALVGLCAEDSRLASCKAWDALIRPDFKDAEGVNKAPFNIAYNTDLGIFEYWKEHRPDLARRANAALAGKGINYGQYLALYPWSAEEDDALIVDIGGGVGGATLPVLRKFPKIRLQVQDLPDTEIKFREFLKEEYSDVLASGRASFLGHNFFEEQPVKGAEIYFLRHVIHDWPDSEAIKLLDNIAQAMSCCSKLLICEHIVSPTYRSEGLQNRNSTVATDEEGLIAPEPLLANWGAGFTSRLDLQVLACLNAKQRTEIEYSSLVAKAGLRVTKVWRNMGDEAIIECGLERGTQ